MISRNTGNLNPWEERHMTKLETDFTTELLDQLKKAETVTGVAEVRLAESAGKNGGVRAVKELLRRGQTTRQFQPLAERRRLDLSPEHLVTKGKYGALFTDEEVDQCLARLLEAGAFSR